MLVVINSGELGPISSTHLEGMATISDAQLTKALGEGERIINKETTTLTNGSRTNNSEVATHKEVINNMTVTSNTENNAKRETTSNKEITPILY